MVDYYAMPQSGPGAWPGRAKAVKLGTIAEKALCVQDAVRDDLVDEMSDRFDSKRFVPFVLMHEFEGLLFSDCAAFSHSIGRSDLEPHFRAIREQFATPEEINDSPNTAPSKRIENLMPSYEKPLFGALAMMEMGLGTIRKECPHFDGWLKKLESLVP